jgi:exodeoxyribonuclease X
MTALLFDTETTGFNEPQVIEAAWLELESPATLAVLGQFEQRYKPSKPIDLGAMAVHHITDEELAACAPSSTFALPPGVQYLIGHNVDFDWKVIGQPPIKRICTLALSRHLFPDIDSHTQSAMVYHFGRARAKSMLKDAHSALADVRNCRHVLRRLIAALAQPEAHAFTWEELWQVSERARIPTRMPYGKHKGMAIAELPADYKAWLLRQTDVDAYLLQALQGGAA